MRHSPVVARPQIGVSSARNTFSVMATRAASEQVFIMVGCVVNSRRAKSASVNDLLFFNPLKAPNNGVQRGGAKGATAPGIQKVKLKK